MPYVTELKPNSAFLPWIAETDALDWGWLAVSRAEPNDVFEHLRSLTQVKMPDGTEVFFRFWDGWHIYPILKGLGDKAGEVLPVFERYLINGQTLERWDASVAEGAGLAVVGSAEGFAGWSDGRESVDDYWQHDAAVAG